MNKSIQVPEIPLDGIILKPITTDLAQEMFQLRTNEAAMEYINKAKPESINDVLEMINGMQAEFMVKKTMAWAIINLEDNRLAGTVGYYRMLPEHFRAEIGYMLHPDFWGKGIMQKAITAVIGYGFDELQLHSIEARINPANEKSRRVLQKFGFVSEGNLRESFYFDGQFLDSEVFGLLVTAYRV